MLDRVGFPKACQEKYAVLRTVNKTDKEQVVTVYGNEQAASITRADQLPYPYGSIIVMETATAKKDSQGKPIVDRNGDYRGDKVLGLHVIAAGERFRRGLWQEPNGRVGVRGVPVRRDLHHSAAKVVRMQPNVMSRRGQNEILYTEGGSPPTHLSDV